MFLLLCLFKSRDSITAFVPDSFSFISKLCLAMQFPGVLTDDSGMNPAEVLFLWQLNDDKKQDNISSHWQQAESSVTFTVTSEGNYTMSMAIIVQILELLQSFSSHTTS
jgi:PKD domain